MSNFFIKLTGVDEEFIDGKEITLNDKEFKLAPLSKNEQNKLATIGFLTLIPTSLYIVAITFFISAFTDKLYFIIPGAIIAGIFIYAIERFFISTSFKESNKEKKKYNYLKLLLRISLAAGLSWFFTHALLIAIFNTEIEAEIYKNRTSIIENYTKNDKSIIEKQSTELACLTKLKFNLQNNISEKLSCGESSSLLSNKEKEIQCVGELLTFESSGEKKTLACGTTSGRFGYRGASSRRLENRATKLENDIKTLKKERNNKILAVTDRISELKGEKSNYSLELNKKKQEIKENNIMSFFGRYDILEDMREKEPHADSLFWSLLIGLLLLELVPILLKTMTKFTHLEMLLIEYNYYLKVIPMFTKNKNLENRSMKKEKIQKNITELEGELKRVSGYEDSSIKRDLMNKYNIEIMKAEVKLLNFITRSAEEELITIDLLFIEVELVFLEKEENYESLVRVLEEYKEFLISILKDLENRKLALQLQLQ